MPRLTALDPQHSTPPLRELPTFEWQQCPVHPVLAISVIVTADAPAWCVGGDEVAGHWLEREQVPA